MNLSNNLEESDLRTLKVATFGLTLKSNSVRVNERFHKYLVLPFTSRALNPEDKFLSGLGFLPQDRLGLSSKPLLLAVIPAQQ